MSAKMYSAKTTIETLHDVARVYLREKSIQDSLNYDTTSYSGETLITTLTPYGLPSGFNTTTSLNQGISLEIEKKTKDGGGYILTANVVATRGVLSDYQLAELARMVGFFAHASGGNVYVSVPVDTVYSDIVSRRETDEQIGFLTELNMNWNRIENVGELHAESGNFYRARIDTLALMGDGVSPNANVFGMLKGNKFRFNKKDSTSPALSVNTSSLTVDNAELQSVGVYGDYLSELNISVGGEIGKTDGTVGLWLLPTATDDDGNVSSCGNLTIGASAQPVNLEIGDSFSATSATGISTKLTVGKFLNVIGNNYDTTHFIGSGMRTLALYSPKITFRNKTFAHLKEYPNDGVQVVISPSGVSEFPDVWLWNCPTGECLLNKLMILDDPKKTSDITTINCATVLKRDLELSVPSSLNVSLLQNIVCKYIYLERAERRINQVLCKSGNRPGCKNGHN